MSDLFHGPAPALTIPVDIEVVALIRLPIAITPLYEITQAINRHFGGDLVFRTDTGIAGWAVISKPSLQGRPE